MFDLNLSQLKTFRTIVEAGSFEAAAWELDITPSAVSQRVKALETSVGRVLLQRTKPIRTTESGESLLLLARQVEELATDVGRQLDDERPTSLALAINSDSLATWVMPALAKVKDLAAFEIFQEDEARTVELLRNGKAMAAVTSVADPVPGCKVSRLGTMRYVAMATPAFADRWFPDGLTADALAVAPHITFDRGDNLQQRYVRSLTRKVMNPPVHYIPSTVEYSTAVLSGMGWGLIPEPQQLRRGSLVDINPGRTIEVDLYWQQWKTSSERLDRVAAAIAEQAAHALA